MLTQKSEKWPIPTLGGATAAPLCFVVDDEIGIRTMIGSALRLRGLAVRELASVPEMMVALEEGPPALIFLDIALADSDAVDAIRGLADRSYMGAVQLVSGKNQDLLDRVCAAGERRNIRMLPPLRKPFSLAEIREITKILAAPDGPLIQPDRDCGGLQMPRPGRPVRIVDLGEALANDWLTFWYQPKVDLRTGRVIGAEALARVVHPQEGTIGPGGFLPGASEADLDALTELAVVSASEDWAEFDSVQHGFRIAVNASAGSLVRVPISSIIRACRPKHPRWPGLLIELTEDEVIKDIEIIQEAATQLSLYNVAFSIDDFGAGYSSFARLKALPFEEVKLDGSFVRGCSTDDVNAGLCRTMIEMAHRFGALVTAEFVETEADRQALQEMGCDIGQGYLFSAPMPKAEFMAFLAEGRAGSMTPGRRNAV